MCTWSDAARDAEAASTVKRRAEQALENILKFKKENSNSICRKTGRVARFYTVKSVRQEGDLGNLNHPTTRPQIAFDKKGKSSYPRMVLKQSDERV